MKLSWNWLQKFFSVDASPQDVGEKITLHTAELEEIEVKKPQFESILWAELISVKKHPESKQLSVGIFNSGKKSQVVFDLPLSEGDIIPLALEGAILPSGKKIEKTKIKNIVSEGMVCDHSKLGFKMDGIFKISEKKFIGKSLSQSFSVFDDYIFDIDNKSLTHRPDLVGHMGFARELSTIFDQKLQLPEPAVSIPQEAKPYPLQIKTKGCYRFCALKIEDIAVSPSALEIQVLLEFLGVKSISNFVDITNLIMLESGEPMHVFDADKVEGSIIIRQATKGEIIKTLDGETYELTPEDIVVADSKKALSLAGIMGGLDSSVTHETKNIIFEVGSWDPVMIRKTSKRLGIRTESSMRYEKSLDPEACRKVLIMAAEKALEICPQAQINYQISDEKTFSYPKINIEFPLEQFEKKAGVQISEKSIMQILSSLGFKIQKTNQKIQVSVPSFRSTKDISIAEDLIEEVLRIYGFENIPSRLPELSITPPKKNLLRSMEWNLRDFFSSNDYLEVYNHSFSRSKTKDFDAIEIENPLSEDYAYLRTNLITNMIAKIESELRNEKSLKFFEIGKTYINTKKILPQETLKGLIFQAHMEGNEDDYFFSLKRDVRAFFDYHKIPINFLSTKKSQSYNHPSKTADIILDNKIIGTLGCLHPNYIPLEGVCMVFAEFEMAPLVDNEIKFEYQKLIPYPPVFRDLSIVLPQNINFAQIVECIKSEGKWIRDVELFDEFQDDEKLGKGIKNFSFHLKFQASQNLNDEIVDEEFKKIVETLNKKHQAQLRLDFDSNK